MQLPTWGTVFAAIAALTGVITSWDKVMAWIDSRRRQRADDARLWSLDVSQSAETGDLLLARLVYDAAAGPPLTLASLRLVAPRGARFVRSQIVGGRTIKSIGSSHSAIVRHDRDLRALIVGGSEVVDLVEMPRRRWYHRHDEVRLRILVVGEERTAIRRERRVLVTSRKVPWPTGGGTK